jgi:di/tripeptidase
MKRNYQLLKDVLSVPTKTYQEDRMVKFICDWLTENNIPYYLDKSKNVYATKSESEISEDFIFPCVISHTDTVHNIDTINVVEEYLLNAQKEEKLSLKAYNDYGDPTGIGGDDKCGVYACLELLKELPFLKAAFFVSEETGCHGSKKADPNFFDNVGYAIQFDAPENWMITEFCMGVPLFERESNFHKKCANVLSENFDKMQRFMKHPYTDVYALKSKFDFSCINISIGYYNYHTRNEYVVVEDVFNGIETGKKMIESLGYDKYEFSVEEGYNVFDYL